MAYSYEVGRRASCAEVARNLRRKGAEMMRTSCAKARLHDITGHNITAAAAIRLFGIGGYTPSHIPIQRAAAAFFSVFKRGGRKSHD